MSEQNFFNSREAIEKFKPQDSKRKEPKVTVTEWGTVARRFGAAMFGLACGYALFCILAAF